MVKVGTVVHELMHALGFLHEQNRSERDGYVYVNWNNIKPGMFDSWVHFIEIPVHPLQNLPQISYHETINSLTGTENNFEKASSQTTDAFGVGYDYGSVMHYSANAFSKNGQATLVAKVS